MKTVFKSSTTFLFVALLLIALSISPLYAAGQYSLSPRVGAQVTKAFELYELEKIEQTLVILNKIKTVSDFDKAYINRFKANLYWQKGDEKSALKSLKIAVESKALADTEQYQSERMLADLYLNQKQTDNAINLYKALIDKRANEDLYKHLALAYYQKKSWNNVVDATINAIKLSAVFNQSIHILQLSALYELKGYSKASKVLVKLTEHDAKNKRWWLQLASIYQLIKQDKKALATYEQAYQLGFINSSSEIKRLANMRASLGAPYQAALLLESAINDKKLLANGKNYQQLAQFWQLSREYDNAQKYWGKSASLSGSGQHYLIQAQLLQLLGKYNKMLVVLASIKPDNEALQGKVALTQIQALFALKKYQQAKEIANQLLKIPNSKDKAVQWIKILDSQNS